MTAHMANEEAFGGWPESGSAAVVIRSYEPRDAADFHRLNAAWIEQHWTLEPKDHETLSNPQASVLDKGGYILMADLDRQVVGCCALLPRADGELELAKMAVDVAARGSGIGRALIDATIAFARAGGAHSLYLESNHLLAPAVRLYERAGFRHLDERDRPLSPYARCDVFMSLAL